MVYRGVYLNRNTVNFVPLLFVINKNAFMPGLTSMKGFPWQCVSMLSFSINEIYRVYISLQTLQAYTNDLSAIEN